MTYQIAFIIEQALGHVTHGQNLQRNISKDSEIEAHWGLPAWQTGGLAGKIPVYKSNWTVQAGLQTRRLLRRMTRQTHLDALFFHTQVTAVLARDWMRRIPGVVSLDATPLQYDALGEFYAHASGPDWLESWKYRLNRDCYRQARRLVTWSAWARQGLIDDYGAPPDKIDVIPPGVNPEEWARPARRDPNRGVVKILFVGGNLERKGGLVLLEAFRALQAGAPLLIAGKPAQIELHLATRDVVPPAPGVFVYNDLQPNSDALKRLYFDCDIFCLPTFGDCLPMVLSEAGAAELPLVSTDVAAIPEIVKEGETGFLLPRKDPAALTGALRTLIANPDLRLQMGARAAQWVRQNYDAEANAARLAALLKRIAREGRENHGR
jgi:glycosyltransferase involved in cell wall biosynthesis